MPYFGQWPEWTPLFLESCRHNPEFDWLFLTDCGPYPGAPTNVRFVDFTLSDVARRARERVGVTKPLRSPYGLCDLRLAFGTIFEEYLDGYDYFGFGDIDVCLGNLAGYLGSRLGQEDIISFHRDYLSGHMAIFRKSQATIHLYRWAEDYQNRASRPGSQVTDEPLFPGGRGWSPKQRHLNLEETGLTVSAIEGYTTPHAFNIPWTDGTYRFPRVWTWKPGSLTNDLDGNREFPYLHFIYWKSRPNINFRYRDIATWSELEEFYYVTWDDLEMGVRISRKGIHPLNADVPISYRDGWVKRHIRRFWTYLRLNVGDHPWRKRFHR